MPEDVSHQLEDAIARGRFEGEVLASLSDIKRVLDDMKLKHSSQDSKIDILYNSKAERKDVEELKKKVWFLAGVASVLGALLSKLFN